MAKTEEDMSGKVSRLPKMFNYVIGVVAVVISFLAWWYPKTDIGGNQVSSTNAGSPVVTTLVTTTSPMISTTLPQSTSTITPLKTATAVLAASETDLVEGKSLKASDLFRISSDGSPNIKSMTTSVCTSAKGLLTFTTSGVCRVQVIVVETSRFKSISKKFSMTIRGALSSQQLSPMKSIFSTSFWTSEPRNFTSIGTSIEWERPAGEFKTTWHVKVSVKLPSDNARCSQILINWRQQRSTPTFGQVTQGCAVTTKSEFDQCIDFTPSRIQSGNASVDLPIVDGSTEKMTFAELYWAIKWVGSEYLPASSSSTTSSTTTSTSVTIPKNDLLWHPAIDVIEVQQGKCV